VAELGEILRTARKQGGNVLIPAFAVGRSQELLYWMAENYEAWDLASWRVVLDSPMAAKVAGVYERNADLFDAEAKIVWGGRIKPFSLPNLRMVSDAKESMALNEVHGGQIIIAGSGMCNGGRIVHHLRHNLWRENAHVVFVGYKGAGTLGRELVDGKTSVRIFGEPIAVKAQCHTLGGLSAHADQAGLMEWYGHFAKHPPVYLVHGEDGPRETLAAKLRQDFGARAELARPGMTADV
jgi:metallo-beta-lactamase family protein